MAIYEGRTGDWGIVVGLEVHAQITSASKLFSGSSAAFGAEANTQVSMVDSAMPGMLPVCNAYCIEQALRTGLALGAQINLRSVFARKNYFYADLPQGYQISQYDQPIVGEGAIEVDLPDGSTKTIRIERLHVEQDAGKSLHDQHPTKTYIDLNRSGVALMEIVSKPDIRSPEEAAAYVKKLRTILRYVGTCDGNMEEGSMRCDINVSVRRPDAEFGTRCEIKNVNSVRHVFQVIEFEARRQIALIEDGGEVVQETRLWDTKKGETRAMRSKENAHDYRYFPDPDLPPLMLSEGFVENIRKSLPELPDAKKQRFMADYGLSAYDATILISEQARADFYEELAKGRDFKLCANWFITELLGALNKSGKDIGDSPISADQLGDLVDLMSNDTISGRIAKDVFALMLETGKTAGVIVEEKGLRQVTDTGALEAVIDEVMAQQADKVAEYRSGKDKLFGFFVGQVMKASGGKANPGMLNDLLKKKLAP
ncbi:MAG TPA: Asp-tRNA(Asn)/Glu-tRNA(Gln) amidotransferase GatCAB subunit B [Rhodospirillaceae bacterium]|nr:MAG: aspartyl/glutamyl-tRNA amidotransferase subunit B [Alphaproteobacteria bacterium GWF2_58_20]HAU29695.1 Asp-tRNA(Asn)/Glu-tRNA(Gln) amidotransferase GatCAB subunit B [Rhodospirillaceae bacterium]